MISGKRTEELNLISEKVDNADRKTIKGSSKFSLEGRVNVPTENKLLALAIRLRSIVIILHWDIIITTVIHPQSPAVSRVTTT